MTDDHATQEPRYASIRDYLRVLRSYRLMILVLAVLGGGVALFLALRQDSVYQATASISFKDETSEFGLVGLSPNTPQDPLKLAAAKARTVTRPEVLSAAARRLGLGQLNASIFPSVDSSSALVNVTGQADDPRAAADAANAVARTTVAISNRQLHARLAHAASTLQNKTAGGKNAADLAAQGYTKAAIERLQSLSTFARAADLVDPASVPATPVSPNPPRSAILGLLGGLLAGLLLAFFRDSLDRRLRSAHEIQAYYDFPILGYVRNEAMGRTAHMTNGANGDHAGTEQIDLEGFRIMRRNLDFVKPGAPLRSILVTSAFPSEGKTTVSSSLAFSMAVGGKRTLLVECDFRRPVLATRLGIEPTPGLSDYLAGLAEPRDVLRTVEFTDPPMLNGSGPNGKAPGGAQYAVVCIPAGTSTPHAAELLGSERLKTFLDQVSRSYEVVIIDSSPLLPVADTLELLPQVDGVIICARELQTTREQALATRETLDHLPERPTALVVTGTKPHEDDYEGYAYSYAYQMQK